MNFNRKSRTTSLVLTVLLGPIGLLYSSVVAGLVLLVVAIVSFGTIVGPIACWVLSIAIGDHMTHKHNEGLDKFAATINKKK